MLLGLYHLRLIANLHSVPARVDDSGIKNKGLFTAEALIRTSYFRDSARRLTMVLLGQEAQEQLQSSFISTNLRFSKIISDPILFRLLNTQGRLSSKILAMVDDIKAISEDELNRVIDQLS